MAGRLRDPPRPACEAQRLPRLAPGDRIVRHRARHRRRRLRDLARDFTFIVVAISIVLLFQWCLERWLIRRTILQLLEDEKPGKGLLGRHRIVLSQDGLVESTAVSESRTSWAGVDRVEQDPHNIYIYTSLAAAHVIPKRAFRDPQETDAFYQFSRAGKEAAG